MNVSSTVASPKLGLPCVFFDSRDNDFSSPSLPRHPHMSGDGQDEPDALSLLITREYEKTIVSTNAINKLTDPTSKFHALSQKIKKRTADARRQLHARKKAALEKLPVLTEENTTLKEQAEQLQAQIAAYELCHLKR